MSSTAKTIVRSIACLIFTISMPLLGGCAGRASVFPNNDKELRKTSAQFAADAASRHPYKADAPRGGDAAARAEIDYGLWKIKLVNLSSNDWNNVEVWVNKDYVVFVPHIEPNKTETIFFQSLYNGQGEHFPIRHTYIDHLEVFMDGKMCDIKTALP